MKKLIFQSTSFIAFVPFCLLIESKLLRTPVLIIPSYFDLIIGDWQGDHANIKKLIVILPQKNHSHLLGMDDYGAIENLSKREAMKFAKTEYVTLLIKENLLSISEVLRS